jgi:hypothetical protein
MNFCSHLNSSRLSAMISYIFILERYNNVLEGVKIRKNNPKDIVYCVQTSLNYIISSYCLKMSIRWVILTYGHLYNINI